MNKLIVLILIIIYGTAASAQPWSIGLKAALVYQILQQEVTNTIEYRLSIQAWTCRRIFAELKRSELFSLK